MKRLPYTICTFGLLAGISACTATTDAGRTRDAEQVALPQARPVDGVLPAVVTPGANELQDLTVQSLLDGSTAHIAIEPQGEGIRIADGRGCVSTRQRDWFAPSDGYTGCGSSADWSSATGEVNVLDSLYPLEVGSTGRYLRRLVSATGEVSTRETECAVTDAVAIALPNRPETPAYVVRCGDGRIERTTWYAPGAGPVAYREEKESGGVREAWVRVN
jgi:hypothetical protein